MYIVLAVVTFFSIIIPVDVFAAATPTISTSLSTTPTISEFDIRDSLQDRLKKAAEAESDTVAQILGASQKKALVGTLKDLTNNTLTVHIKNGGTTLAGITETTTFIRKGKTVKQGDLVIGDFFIVMGYMNGNNLLDAKRVIVVDSPTQRPVRKIVIGTVTEISMKKKSFMATVGRPAELGGPETITVVIPKASDLDLSDLELQSRLLIVALANEKTPPTFTLQAHKIL